eukprot:CAMPEP_0170198784 /NCGR_PEP_ID=MMETSP0040_2-20121228/68976_1 /TAXON_ID=641309 /ORGANISM="Lotharella oceanica, Strain CCMP622" /LENGTH=198 /DNA_ID=CAMNT_0010448833 /DNA_START=657 /DNA_END=1250 /DNA_ORIENTATION=+
MQLQIAKTWMTCLANPMFEGRFQRVCFAVCDTTQEESLARSSGLFPCLLTQEDTFYIPHRNSQSPFYSSSVIFSPRVPFFKKDDGSLLDTPVYASVLTSAAVNAGVVRKRNGNKMDAKIMEENKKRMMLALKVAALKGQEVLILGAFGCGVFKNSPDEIAKTWMTCLANPMFEGRFQRVCFAVCDTTKDRRVLRAFDW